LRELTRSNDMVWLSWLSSLLADAGIPCHMLDAHMSALEGSITAIPRRIMVADEDFDEAARLMAAGKDSVS
jgi:Putative prokaryotic signal transducing protein